MFVTFKNAYLKKPRHVWSNAQSPSQSVLLTALPEGEILHLDTIVKNILSNKDNDSLKNERDIKICLSDSIKQGFIVEVVGESLWRLFRDKLK